MKRHFLLKTADSNVQAHMVVLEEVFHVFPLKYLECCLFMSSGLPLNYHMCTLWNTSLDSCNSMIKCVPLSIIKQKDCLIFLFTHGDMLVAGT